jgi:hypothetical protein
MNVKDFSTWLKEDFAAVGVAPAGNVIGMGDVSAPTSTNTGSGDTWPSLGAPSSLAPLAYKKRKRRKKKTKKVEESKFPIVEFQETPENEINFSDTQEVDFFLDLLSSSANKEINDFDWLTEFDQIYNTVSVFNLDRGKPQRDFRENFSIGNVTYGSFSEDIDDSEKWKLVYALDLTDDGDGASDYFHERLLTNEEKKNVIERIPGYIREYQDLSQSEMNHLLKFISSEERDKLRGVIAGKKFGL